MTRERDMSVKQPAALSGGVERHKVVIIGAGFGGLGAGYRLKQAGEHDFMTEAQIEHMLRVIRLMQKRRYDMVEPRASAQQRFVDEMDREMEGTVWTAGGCQSWYLDRTGRNSTLWPGSALAFRRRAVRLQERDYEGQRAVGRAQVQREVKG